MEYSFYSNQKFGKKHKNFLTMPDIQFTLATSVFENRGIL